MDNLVWLVVAAGCIWHGAQIIWVAPTPTQLRKHKPVLAKGSSQAFQVFWLDQYAWIGICLVLLGLILGLAGVLL
jgi:hypothetical protein